VFKSSSFLLYFSTGRRLQWSTIRHLLSFTIVTDLLLCLVSTLVRKQELPVAVTSPLYTSLAIACRQCPWWFVLWKKGTMDRIFVQLWTELAFVRYLFISCSSRYCLHSFASMQKKSEIWFFQRFRKILLALDLTRKESWCSPTLLHSHIFYCTSNLIYPAGVPSRWPQVLSLACWYGEGTRIMTITFWDEQQICRWKTLLFFTKKLKQLNISFFYLLSITLACDDVCFLCCLMNKTAGSAASSRHWTPVQRRGNVTFFSQSWLFNLSWTTQLLCLVRVLNKISHIDRPIWILALRYSTQVLHLFELINCNWATTLVW
jgi:hypothetical protein